MQAILSAIDDQNVAMVRTCLSRSSENVNRVVDSDGSTLLHRCVLGHSQSKSDCTVELKDIEAILSLLLASRADINATNMLGETPLLAAARNTTGHSLASALLTAGADPNITDSILGETVLMEAACSGDSISQMQCESL